MGRRYIAFHPANFMMFCYCSHHGKCDEQVGCPSMHALTERSSLPENWYQRGIAMALHHGLEASCM